MSQPGTAHCFNAPAQDPVSAQALKGLSYRETMQIAATIPSFHTVMRVPGGAT